MKSLSTRRELAFLMVLSAALVMGFHWVGELSGLRIDWSTPLGWVDEAGAEEVAMATLRYVGLVVGYWVLASATLSLVALQAQRPNLLTAVKLVSLPGIRRILDRALAAALAASLASSPVPPAQAEEVPASPQVMFDINSDGVPIPLIRLDNGFPVAASSDHETPRIETPQVRIPQYEHPTSRNQPVAHSDTYEVVGGDNLWLIAERQIGDTPDIDRVTDYWRRLVANNTPTLRSGDPNLIFPGEVIALPGVESSP
jgi:nucleoid-associated protein YgaU